MIRVIKYSFMFGMVVSLYALPPINLLRPSDPFLIPERVPCMPFQFTVGYEGSISSRGFRDNDCDLIGRVDTGCKEVNVLQIYQHEQNVLAAFKGFDSKKPLGQISQLFNMNDENGMQGRIIPTGHFKVPMNLMFAARWYGPHDLWFGLFLPVYIMELCDVHWREKTQDKVMEDRIESDFVSLIEHHASLSLRGWRRTGIGDLLGQIAWTRDFPQARPLITNARAQLRLGVSAPTGLKQDEDRLLAIPFGNDGSWGILVGGDLALTFCSYLRGGIDAEFLYLFGNTRPRRVRTDRHQTDLLFLTKVPVFREFGLSQQYNIFLESGNFCRGLSLKLNYQYLRRNEDRLFLCNDRIDPVIVNNAESLQEWTAHSLIFGIKYDCFYDIPTAPVVPSFLGWVKWGFNGKRAILLNTVGFAFTVSF